MDYKKQAEKELSKHDGRVMRDVLRLKSDGYTVTFFDGQNCFSVDKPKGKSYIVRDDGESGLQCGCLARGTCKHIILVSFLRDLMPQMRYSR